MENSDTRKWLRNALSMWVVYKSPIEYPGKYVVKRWDIGKGTIQATDDCYVTDSLDAAREALPLGMTRMERSKGDPAHIVESWI